MPLFSLEVGLPCADDCAAEVTAWPQHGIFANLLLVQACKRATRNSAGEMNAGHTTTTTTGDALLMAMMKMREDGVFDLKGRSYSFYKLASLTCYLYTFTRTRRFSPPSILQHVHSNKLAANTPSARQLSFWLCANPRAHQIVHTHSQHTKRRHNLPIVHSVYVNFESISPHSNTLFL